MSIKGLNKTTFIIIAVIVMIGWSFGSYYVVAYKGVDFFSTTENGQPIATDPTTNVDAIINPPLGNFTTLPSPTALFTLLVMTFPIELTMCFTAELIFSPIARDTPKKKNFIRLLIIIGSAAVISIGSALIHYFMVWPALHDWPIHQGYTFIEPVTHIEYPQYGDFEAIHSIAVDVILFLTAAILVVGIRFPVYKYIQKLNYVASGISMAFPAIYYPVFWSILAKQVTEGDLTDKTGSHIMLFIIISGAFVLGMILLLIWNLTLLGTQPEEQMPQQ
ncbi:MAG: hypothetical protein FK734_09640 [Asgard group archaeon]|nr:hypothetical protein [Asgard group archaeon]